MTCNTKFKIHSYHNIEHFNSLYPFKELHTLLHNQNTVICLKPNRAVICTES